MAGQRQPRYKFDFKTPTNVDPYTSTTSSFLSMGKSNLPSWKQKSSSSASQFFGKLSSSSSSVTPGTSLRGSTPYKAFTRTPINPPGSRKNPHHSSSVTSAASGPSVLVALVEGRGLAKGEIGMASLDLKRPELLLSQFSDSQTYVKVLTKLQVLQPLEVIIPNTACEAGKMTKLCEIITDQFSNVSLSTVQRKYFNESQGLQYIKQLCVPEFNAVEMEVSSKYYCLATASALLKYVEFIQNLVYAPGSLRIVFKGSEQTTMIDASTARNLELVLNARNLGSDHCLYGVMNHTKTAAGARMLRSNILQPPSDVGTINTRLDCVTELLEKEEEFYTLQSVLARFLDVDHITTMCIQVPKTETVKTAESKITNVIYLKHTLELVDPLREALKNFENTLFTAYYQTLSEPRFKKIMAEIQKVIHDDTRYQKGTMNMRTQKCFAIKPHINGLLDVARRTYTEIVDDSLALVKQLGERHDLPIKSAYNTTRGFHAQMNLNNNISIEELPSQFIKVVKTKNVVAFTTADLIKLNDRIRESMNEIYLMTNIVVSELLAGIRDQIGCLYKLSDCVATLDLLVSFAHSCTLAEYVRPEFTDTLAIQQGRHPILDKILSEPPVPNNTYAADGSNFVIITGPNMSGKSTYLKQIALLQIMAQIGSFVPAEYASFRIARQLFTRIGSDDDIETNSSTFMLEMKEINYILQNVTNDSLIIIDELGRGTSSEEGLAICYSICEHLLANKAFTFFATHFLQLTTMDGLYPNIENYHMEIQRVFNEDAQGEKISYTHTLSKGSTSEKHYGLELAKLSALPGDLLHEAEELSKTLTEQKKSQSDSSIEARKERAIFRLGNKLTQAAKNSRLDENGLRAYLQGLSSQYYRDIEDTEE
ncbi:mutS protein homolog 4-like [Dendronephthya gigantea]|uniref:mutS protein homolog 4-like n=1 Tax=Dendronephthya gigantea TaxID=151771 RepID=UPI00106BE4DC|nr:mutS protein homolog 4-like [Dendronephthya gigantea]